MDKNYYIEEVIVEMMVLMFYNIGCCSYDDVTFGKVATLGLMVEIIVDDGDDDDKRDLGNLGYD